MIPRVIGGFCGPERCVLVWTERCVLVWTGAGMGVWIVVNSLWFVVDGFGCGVKGSRAMDMRPGTNGHKFVASGHEFMHSQTDGLRPGGT
eukprot:363457-Chlamydomonas_euryale.AAC.3